MTDLRRFGAWAPRTVALWVALGIVAGCSGGGGGKVVGFPDGGMADDDGGTDGQVVMPDGGFVPGLCNTTSFAPCTTSSDCDDGEACVPGGCPSEDNPREPTNYCAPAGTACATADDCCDEPPCSNVICSATNVCVSETEECNGWRTCAKGYACEDGECKNRRLPCVGLTDCPADSTCFREPGTAMAFCLITVTDTCATDEDCGGRYGMACVDILDDGHKRCVDIGGRYCELGEPIPSNPEAICEYTPECASIVDCAGGDDDKRTCGRAWDGIGNECTGNGMCRDENDCPAGYGCYDVSGVGVKRCLAPGECTADSDCPLDTSRCVDRFLSHQARCSNPWPAFR